MSDIHRQDTSARADDLASRPPTVALIGSTLDLGFLVKPLRRALPGATIKVWPQDDVSEAEIAVCWYPPPGVLATMARLRLAHSIAAGLDTIFADPGLPAVPVCRVVDAEHARGMAEYALWATTLFHRQLDVVLRNQRLQAWERPRQRPAEDVTVGVMGWGTFGQVVGRRLRACGYGVRGWARSSRPAGDISVFAGEAERDAFLAETNVLICLLPLTEETRDILNGDLFARLPAGAALINIGRGEHLVEADLIAALDGGHLRGAILDVFREEPLPSASPLWHHPRIIVTPHVASMPRTAEVARQIADNATRVMTGRPVLNAGDRARGY